MSHLSYITKKCQEANPKLLEPSIGCVIKYKGEMGIVAGFDIPRCIWLMNNVHGNIMPVGFGLEEVEILGHPIQLSDVLKALGHDYAVNGEGNLMILDLEHGNGYLLGVTDRRGDFEQYPEYDLSKPLSEQSPETLEWIAVQLGYKE